MRFIPRIPVSFDLLNKQIFGHMNEIGTKLPIGNTEARNHMVYNFALIRNVELTATHCYNKIDKLQTLGLAFDFGQSISGRFGE